MLDFLKCEAREVIAVGKCVNSKFLSDWVVLIEFLLQDDFCNGLSERLSVVFFAENLGEYPVCFSVRFFQESDKILEEQVLWQSGRVLKIMVLAVKKLFREPTAT